MTSRTQTVSLLVLLCCSGLGFATPTLTVLPLNDAVLVGSTVELTCSCAVSPPATRIMWKEYASQPGGALISDNRVVLPSHPSASRFSIVGEGEVYNLRIRNVSLGDAGTYLCEDVLSTPPSRGYAELIVLDGDPVCQDILADSGAVLEGLSYSSECKIGYKGSIAPIMEWTGPGNFVTNGSTTPEFVWSWKRFTADKSVNGGVFSFHMHFPQIVADPGHADNAPTYEHTYHSAVLQISWGPKEMFITPVKVEYAVGDVLTCVADASPAAVYTWQNMRTLVIYTGQTFTITQDLLGFNQTMRCQAQNEIHGIFYFDNVYESVYVPGIRLRKRR